MTPSRPDPVGTALATAQAVGLVALGAVVGRRLDHRRGAVVAATIAAAVATPYGGAVARHRPYGTIRPGLLRWLVDSTWSAPNTFAGAVFFAHQRLRGNPEVPERSRGSGSIWLERSAIRGYATTIGIVKAGSSDRVDRHEDVHVFQARLLGPLYLPFVVIDYVLATVVPLWLLDRGPDARPIRSVRHYFERGVYREVWHERWAYASARPYEEWAQQDSNL